MKVLLVVPRLNIGGAESYVFTLAVGLQNRGIDVVIVSGGGHLANELKEAGFKHYYCPIRLNRYLAAHALTYIIWREEIDLVHANSTAAAYAAAIACETAGVPWVMTAHGVFSSLEADRGIRQAARIICVSDFLKNYLNVNSRVPSSSLVTIYNGVDLELFNQSKANKNLRSNWNLKDDDFVVGLIGRMATRNNKGHYDMIQAMATQSKSKPWKLLVIGKGKAAWRIKLKVMLMGLRNRIIFAGHQTDVPNTIAACDLLILPSALETFGLVLAEGMAMKKPVISYAVGGTPEAVEHGISGFLVSSGNANEMMELIDQLYHDRELGKTLGENGLKRVETLFDSKNMVEETIALYNKVLGSEVDKPCP